VVALSGTGALPVSYTVSFELDAGFFDVFRVQRLSGTISGGPYTRVDSSMIPTTSYTDAGVASGQTYFYVATELDSIGTESGYSSEVSATIP